MTRPNTGVKIIPLTNSTGKTGCICQRMKYKFILLIAYKNQHKVDQRPVTLKFLEQKPGETLHNIDTGDSFLR